MTDSPESEKCLDCGEIKPAREFWRRKQSPDGLSLYCKPCFGVRNGDSYRHRRRAEGFEARPYRPRPAAPDGMKYCPRCDETKLVSEFGGNRATKSGLTDYCKPCHNAVMAEIKTRVHGSTRNYHLKRRYKMTADEVQALIEQQVGICAICLRAPAIQVDHDHATGAVRGVLCFTCNLGLGNFKDSPDLLRRAINYLEGDVWRPVPIAPGVYQVPS